MGESKGPGALHYRGLNCLTRLTLLDAPAEVEGATLVDDDDGGGTERTTVPAELGGRPIAGELLADVPGLLDVDAVREIAVEEDGPALYLNTCNSARFFLADGGGAAGGIDLLRTVRSGKPRGVGSNSLFTLSRITLNTKVHEFLSVITIKVLHP